MRHQLMKDVESACQRYLPTDDSKKNREKQTRKAEKEGDMGDLTEGDFERMWNEVPCEDGYNIQVPYTHQFPSHERDAQGL